VNIVNFPLQMSTKQQQKSAVSHQSIMMDMSIVLYYIRLKLTL